MRTCLTRSLCVTLLIAILVVPALSAVAADPEIEAMSCVRENNYAKALILFKRSSELKPQDPNQNLFLGNCYNELGDTPKALEQYQIAIRKGGVTESLAFNLSSVYQKQGDYSQALKWLETACILNPPEGQRLQTINMLKKLRDKSKSSKNGSINLENYLVELDSTHVWKKSLLPLKVFVISESTEVRGEISALKVVTKDAATEWCEASNNKLSCIFVGNAADANILVEYTTDPSKVRKDHSMGVSGSTSVRLEKGTGEIVAAEMKILVLDSGQNLASARKNCLHEFGHALGLQGHSDNNKDLMFFISELKTVPTTLSKRDKETMKSLYRNY